MKEELLILRDYLAIDRTKLANLRTFLAYFRTSLLVCASGISFFKIFSDELIIKIIGLILIPISIVIFFYGVSTYFIFRKRIKSLYDGKFITNELDSLN
jgi:putative membrane protein